MRSPKNNLQGMKFGRLTVLSYIPGTKKKGNKWVCKCDCGNLTEVYHNALTRNVSKSCGCLRKEVSGKTNLQHGITDTRIYKIWEGIKSRCSNSKLSCYKNYGGRGIKVCQEWLHSPTAFYNWAIANGYEENLTLDREDVNGDYTPQNCRWVDYKTQANNKRTNAIYELNGELKTLAQWCDIFGINYFIVHNRLRSGNYTLQEALTEEINSRMYLSHNAKRYVIKGEYLTLREISEKYKIDKNIIKWRIQNGWSDEEVLRKEKGVKRRNVKQ